MKQSMSRRSFLTGAAAAGVLAAVPAITGCSPAGKQDSGNSGGGAPAQADGTAGEGLTYEVLDEKWDFEIPSAAISDDQITDTISADIVVVGSGLAGMVTAVSAMEHGAKNVVVVSASSKGISRGGSNFAIGSKAQKEQGINMTVESMRGHIKQEQTFGGLYCDGGKWSDWMNHTTEVMDWMIDRCASRGLKVSLEPGLTDPDGVFTIQPAAHNFFNDEFPLGFKDGAPLQVNAMVDIFQELGGTVYFDTKVVQLTRGGAANGTSGAVDGCIAEKADGSYVKYEAAKAVVLATGDFSRNKSMMAKYAPWVCETFKDVLTFDEPDYNVEANWSGLMPGDGHMMALWIGAAWQKGPNAPMVCNGVPGPVKQGALANFWGINMNNEGKRYINEITNFAYAGVAITQQPEQTVFGIWDTAYAQTQDAWDYYGCTVGNVNGCVPNTPDQLIAEWDANVESGTYYKADTIEELVDILAQNGLKDKETALKTISDYTRYAEQGRDEEFDVNPEVLYPVSTPPFYASKAVGTSFLTVCGGIRTNSQMQALDADDQPIEGLYTTGIMAGDVYGSTYNFVLPGFNLGGVCGTLSYLLGQRLAEK